jgi:hypothetical protein
MYHSMRSLTVLLRWRGRAREFPDKRARPYRRGPPGSDFSCRGDRWCGLRCSRWLPHSAGRRLRIELRMIERRCRTWGLEGARSSASHA